MARENCVLLHGQVYERPRVYLNANGEAKRATFAVKVLRRPFLTGEGQIAAGKLYIDYPIVLTSDAELIKVSSTLRKGDMVDVRGVLTTREVTKKSTCPNGHENTSLGNFVFITPIYICRREPELNEEQGMELLRARAEISNVVMIIGTLCRDPVFYEYEDKRACMTQYQIAANRRYHIRDGHDEERTDYPWVKTINRQARDDNEHLRLNSTVFINGAVQTREIEREIICEECGEPYSIKEGVAELFPYSVEYLMNCVFDEAPKTEDTDSKEGGE